MPSRNSRTCSRKEFLRRGAQSLGAAAFLLSIPKRSSAQQPTTRQGNVNTGASYDLREFVRWIVNDFEPSVRLSGGAGHYARSPGDKAIELYGTSDMACILYTLGRLKPTEKERTEWAEAFQSFQNPDTGYLLEKNPTHAALHNTAFALGAMQLLDLSPKYPLKMAAEFADVRAYLGTLDWEKAVYTESHKGAGIGSIYTLAGLGTPQWFAEYFSTCDSLFDPNNGLMGKNKPPGGDFDQVGGTFHYNFLYTYFNRRMPYPEKRIDAVLGIQRPDGHWDSSNRTWLTLDGIYLLTRTLRYCPHRADDVHKAVRRTMDTLMQEMYSPAVREKAFTGRLPVHSVTCAISIAAEAQQFFGADQVITDWPLKLVLDRRPFI